MILAYVYIVQDMKPYWATSGHTRRRDEHENKKL